MKNLAKSTCKILWKLIRTSYKKHLFFCINERTGGKNCCARFNAKECYRYAKDKMREQNQLGKHKIGISASRCLGRCEVGPVVVVYPEGVWYRYSTFADIDTIIKNHLLEDKIVSELVLQH